LSHHALLVAREIKEMIGAKPCLLAIDVDGTLTSKRARGEFLLDFAAASLIAKVEEKGTTTMLVTGNSAPVAAGLARYLGSRGPQVAENGCLVFYNGRIWSSCRYTARPAARIVERELSGLLNPSWQNTCRIHDYAFLARNPATDPSLLLGHVEKVLESHGIEAKLSSSGYAIHVRPPDASKANGVALAASLLGVDTSCIVAVGDSSIDVEMRPSSGILAAVGNADPALKKEADIVLPGESGTSLRILLEAILHLAH